MVLIPLNKEARRLEGKMLRTLDSGWSGSESSPGRGSCAVFLGKTLYSHGASLHPGVNGYQQTVRET